MLTFYDGGDAIGGMRGPRWFWLALIGVPVFYGQTPVAIEAAADITGYP